jgi:hypothetical protein
VILSVVVFAVEVVIVVEMAIFGFQVLVEANCQNLHYLTTDSKRETTSFEEERKIENKYHE